MMQECVVVVVMMVAMAVGLVGGGVAAQTTHGAAAPQPFTVVLGITQDAGYPQAGCHRDCCAPVANDQSLRRHVSCLAIVDPVTHQRWMIEATPDFREQLAMLDAVEAPKGTPGLDGILLTHGHIGHYTGLMFVGHESIGAKGVAVYAMPRMREFLSSNGPWDQLVRYGNIVLRDLVADEPVALNPRITITPFRVPHREEYTEVVGYRIEGPGRRVVFIPDIDKWERWERRIEDVIAESDVVYVDGSFYADGELPHRDMSGIPHPFIVQTMERLAALPASERAKVRFLHLNHTNPALAPGSEARRAIAEAGFAVAEEGEREALGQDLAGR